MKGAGIMKMHDPLMIGVTDCTLRDGGYVNEHRFTTHQVVHTVTSLVDAGVDLVEVGYFRRDSKPIGVTAYCPDSLLELLPLEHKGRLAVMARPGVVKPSDVIALRDSAVSHIRIPARLDEIEAGFRLMRVARECGLKVCFNVIRVSELSIDALQGLLHQIKNIQPEVLFFADSNGAMFPSQVEKLIRFAREQVDIPLGFHAHDNLGFAVANAMAAVTGGARWIDSTVGGLGKGGGNASTEAILTLVAGLTGRTIQLSRLLDAVSIYPEGLFPPRMQSRIESSLFGLYNCNLETIARLKAVATDNFEQIHEQLQAMSINHELPVDCLSEKLKCWWRSAVCGLTTG